MDNLTLEQQLKLRQFELNVTKLTKKELEERIVKLYALVLVLTRIVGQFKAIFETLKLTQR